MHKGLFRAIAPIFAVTLISIQAQTTPVPLKVRMICYDLMVFPAQARFLGGIVDENRFSSQGRFNAANDELAFANVPTTHFGTFQYTDGQFFETFPLPFEVDIPGNDANQNGIYDLLEYDQAVPTTTTFGTYTDPEGGVGDFLARWTKTANSHSGTVVIIFDFNNPVGFTHGFEIFNYEGDWTSAVKENAAVHGAVTVVRDGIPEQTLGGDFSLALPQPAEVKLNTTSFTNELGATFDWTTPLTMNRDRTEYYAFLTVTDGWLYDPRFDFVDWLIIVDDKNDWDKDGIPDLTDPPPLIAAAPTMQIIRTGNGIRLMITGDVGATYTLEDASSLPAPQWLHPTAVTLTASPHIVDLPAPTIATFWRMRFP